MLEIHLGWKEFLCLVAKPDMTFEYRWLWKTKVSLVENSWILPLPLFFLFVACLESPLISQLPKGTHSDFCFDAHVVQGKLILPLALEMGLGLPSKSSYSSCLPYDGGAGDLRHPVRPSIITLLCFLILGYLTTLRDASLKAEWFQVTRKKLGFAWDLKLPYQTTHKPFQPTCSFQVTLVFINFPYSI